MKLHTIVINQHILKEFVEFLYSQKCYIFGIRVKGIYRLVEFGSSAEFNFFQDHLDDLSKW